MKFIIAIIDKINNFLELLTLFVHLEQSRKNGLVHMVIQYYNKIFKNVAIFWTTLSKV